MSDRRIIEEQIEYYERRAPEYDETATPEDDPLRSQEVALVAALDTCRPSGRVLEIACGTGTWTSRLLRWSGRITAVDASPSMLELNHRQVRDPRVEYVLADVFEWEPDHEYDFVFFANWLSHVPPSRFESFWNLVERALAPEGRFFFVDEAEDAWRHEEALAEEFIEDEATPLVRRRLRDGSVFRVVKVFWNAAELQRRLRAVGWDVTMGNTGAFYWGEGTRLPESSAGGTSTAQPE